MVCGGALRTFHVRHFIRWAAIVLLVKLAHVRLLKLIPLQQHMQNAEHQRWPCEWCADGVLTVIRPSLLMSIVLIIASTASFDASTPDLASTLPTERTRRTGRWQC